MLDRRQFLVFGAAGLTLAACGGVRKSVQSPAPDDWIVEKTVAELGELMASGQKTARALAEAYLARVRAIDPQLESVIEVNPDALSIADAMDAERKAGKTRGPLHGIPVMVKDNLDTGDKMQTTAGSLALVGAPTPKDSAVVAKLRAAGAVLLGKTNLSEWANIRSTRSTSGWSGRGGQTKNPYALDRNPCGSSSGSGAAVAANLCAVAIGTETDGSILCPSSVCGLVGIKPTVGLVSRAGIIPIAHTQDTAGPMARTVSDAEMLLAAIADRPLPARPSVKGMKIGVVRALFGKHPEHDHHVEQAIAALKAAGVEVVDPIELPSLPGGPDAPEMTVLMTELKADLDKYLAARGGPLTSLADVIAWNEQHAADEMSQFGQELFIKAQATTGLEAKEYQAALAKYAELKAGVEAVISKQGISAFVGPVYAPAQLTDAVLGDYQPGGGPETAAQLGYPSMTVPVGFTRGLPVGMLLFGAAYTEHVLIALAGAVEGALHARRPPALRPSADLRAPSDCGENCATPGR